METMQPTRRRARPLALELVESIGARIRDGRIVPAGG